MAEATGQHADRTMRVKALHTFMHHPAVLADIVDMLARLGAER